MRVFVSDNSSTSDVRRVLSSWIRASCPDVTLFATDRDLPMSEHWDWAVDNVLASTDATHLSVLTDRMRFRRYGLRRLLRAIRAVPDDLVTYGYDTIDDWDEHAIRVELMSRTRRLYRVRSRDLLEHVAEGNPLAWQIPKALNSAFPRRIVEELRASRPDGRLFASLSPDYYFGFKALASASDFVVCDDGVLVQFGLRRSNGGASLTGVTNEHARDFLRLHGGELVFDSPFPRLVTALNSIVHEYNVVRAECGADRMPPFEDSIVRSVLEIEARHMRNPAMRQHVLDQLGIDPAEPAVDGAEPRVDTVSSLPPDARTMVGESFRWQQLGTALRHPIESLRVASHRLGIEGVWRRTVVPALIRPMWATLERTPGIRGWVARTRPVCFSSLDQAIGALEHVVPVTRGAAPPPGVSEADAIDESTSFRLPRRGPR